jgi:hypothetical protein
VPAIPARPCHAGEHVFKISPRWWMIAQQSCQATSPFIQRKQLPPGGTGDFAPTGCFELEPRLSFCLPRSTITCMTVPARYRVLFIEAVVFMGADREVSLNAAQSAEVIRLSRLWRQRCPWRCQTDQVSGHRRRCFATRLHLYAWQPVWRLQSGAPWCPQ